LHQSFEEAVASEPPEGQWLPEITKTKKSVGKLYESVVQEWTKVQFLSAEDEELTYSAVISTDAGTISIELWPRIAPNHVRNFVALSRAGYYDGLTFDRAIKRDDGEGKTFECLEGGCPLGTGEPNYGSIGYWLKPEFDVTVTHAPGTIGAWHGEDMESAACKFYINLSKADWMDGSFTLFGKVTKGLEVLRAIHARPVGQDGLRDRPVEPVVIRRVVIHPASKHRL
jgi:cyclophilin family peptidyl-prolyl cis-trans isomerase